MRQAQAKRTASPPDPCGGVVLMQEHQAACAGAPGYAQELASISKTCDVVGLSF